MSETVVVSREVLETRKGFADDDAALLHAVRESLRLFGASVEVVFSDGKRCHVWTTQ